MLPSLSHVELRSRLTFGLFGDLLFNLLVRNEALLAKTTGYNVKLVERSGIPLP